MIHPQASKIKDILKPEVAPNFHRGHSETAAQGASLTEDPSLSFKILRDLRASLVSHERPD
jgi:hypothetical protein